MNFSPHPLSRPSFSLDERFVLWAACGGEIVVLDLDKKAFRNTGALRTRTKAAVIAPDGKFFALLTANDSLVQLYALEGSSKIWEKRLSTAKRKDGLTSDASIAFLDGGTKLLCHTPDGVRIIDVASQESTLRPKLKNASANLSYDGRVCLNLKNPFEMVLWELASESPVAKISSAPAEWSAVRIGPTHFRLVTGSHDGTVLLWDLSALSDRCPAAAYASGPPEEFIPRLWDDLGKATPEGYETLAIFCNLPGLRVSPG